MLGAGSRRRIPLNPGARPLKMDNVIPQDPFPGWSTALRGLVVILLVGWAPPARAGCEAYLSPEALQGQLDDALAIAYYLFEPERAVTSYRAAEASLGCLTEVVPPDQLARLYLWLGSVYLDLGRDEEAAAAVARAASVSSGVALSEPTLSQRVRLLYLEALNASRHHPPATLRLGDLGDAAIALDGVPHPPNPSGGGGDADPLLSPTLTLVPGQHFLQMRAPGGWVGRWVTLPEGSAQVLDREAGGLRIYPEGPSPVAAAAAPERGDSDEERLGTAGRWALSLAGVGALAGGIFLYEEALFRAGALIGPDGPVENYARHYYVHGASGVAAVTLTAGAAAVGLIGWSRRRTRAERGEEDGVALSLSPTGLSLGGRF